MFCHGNRGKRKGLQFQYSLAENLEEYYKGDSLRIRQILTNLLGNAIKFTKEGFIQLSITTKEEEVLFHIQDSGIGIAPDRLEKIFDPFTQADVSMSRKFGGTGLGTTISKQLVELMKGKIWVESELGAGTHFYVSLPLEKGNPILEFNEKIQFDLPSMDILIVDDVKQNVELIELLMTSNGHKVEIAKNGREALEFFKSKKFDLVLMDIQMPEMDGLEATRQIRDYEKSSSIRTPIIALSASVFEEDKVSAKNAGMDGFVSKPIDIHDLFFEIKKLIQGSLVKSVPMNTKVNPKEAFQTQRGISLFGSLEKYVSMLDGFFRDFQFEIEESLIHLGNPSGEQAFLHKIKGVSSNLGVVLLSEISNGLENKLQNGKLTQADFESLQEAFRESYGQFLKEFGRKIAKEEVIQTQTKVLLESEKIDILKSIGVLTESFSKGSLDQKEWNVLSNLLSETKFLNLIFGMESSIQQFDFENSIKLLNDLKIQIKEEQ